MPDNDTRWVFKKHIKGSSNHKSGSNSWVQYWKDKTELKLPDLCPCDRTGEADNKQPAHGITATAIERTNQARDEGDRSAGAHVMVINSDLELEIFAIAPCCGSCNNHNVEGNLRWFFRAVTILQNDKLGSKFAGMITLPKEYADNKNGWWWQRITAFSVDDETITIEGYSNNDNNDVTPANPCNVCTFGVDHVCNGCKKRRAKYNNIDGRDYLSEIAHLWRRAQQKNNFTVRGSVARYQEDFKPVILRCNVGMYPGKSPEERNKYKQAYGLCMHVGCHNDSNDSVGGEYCGVDCKNKVCARQGCYEDKNNNGTSDYCKESCQQIAGKHGEGRCMKMGCDTDRHQDFGEYCTDECRQAVCARQGCYKDRIGVYCGETCRKAVCKKQGCYKDRIGVYCGETCRKAVCKKQGCYVERLPDGYCSDACRPTAEELVEPFGAMAM